MNIPLRQLLFNLHTRPAVDATELKLTRDEVLMSLTRSNYVTLIFQGFSFDRTNGSDLNKTLEILNLTLVQSAVICFAICRASPSQPQRTEAMLILIRKLGQIGVSILGKDYKNFNVSGIRNLSMVKVGIPNDAVVPEKVLHELIMWIASTYDTNLPNIGNLQAIPELNIFLSANIILASNDGSVSALEGRGASEVKEEKAAIATLLTEMGSGCSKTPECFLSVVKFLVSSQKIPFDDEQVSALLVESVCVWSNSNAENTDGTKFGMQMSLLKMFMDSGEASKDFDFDTTGSGTAIIPWNMDNVLTGIQLCISNFVTNPSKLDWLKIAQSLDRKSLRLFSDYGCDLLVDMYCKISGTNFPASVLTANWDNRFAQFVLLAWLSSKTFANISTVDVSPFQAKEQLCDPITGANETVFQTVWASTLFYTTLMTLSKRGGGLSAKVIQLLLAKVKFYPEYLLVCLAKLKEDDSAYSVRSEVLHQLLPMFSGLPGALPTSDTMSAYLSESNPEMLELLFRVTMRLADTVQSVTEASTKLKATNDKVFANIEKSSGNSGALDDLLGYWCVKADRVPGFNLEKFVMAALHENTSAAHGIFQYIQIRLNKLRLRASTEGGLLSFESGAALLQALQSSIPMEKLRRVMHVLQQGFQQHRNTMNRAEAAGNLGDMSSSSSSNGPIIPPTISAVAPALTTLPSMSPLTSSSSSGGSNAMNSDTTSSLVGNDGDSAGGSGVDDFEAFAKQGPSQEISAKANQYFQKIYKGEISIPDTLNLLQQMKSSTVRAEQEIFMCMVLNLFDEYRFFPKYPKKELQISGILFGSLIDLRLLSGKTLVVAMRLVLEALNKDPKTPTSGNNNSSLENIFNFGVTALEHFRNRLGEMPRYCRDIASIPHFSRECADLYQELSNILAKNEEASSTAANTSAGSLGLSGNSSLNALSGGAKGGSNSISSTSHDANEVNQGPSVMDSEDFVSIYNETLEKMGVVNIDNAKTAPSETMRDKIHFIFNNISAATYESKSMEIASMLREENIPWFASYIIEKRVSAQPNFHSLYLNILDMINNTDLDKSVLNSTYYNITRLLQSPTITTSTQERSVLRNLGMWLGQITLAKNKPILQRRLNLKNLLFWGFETGRLIAVCSFVAKIVEGVKTSTIFRPPNPWLMALLGVLRDLYETDDLKMNIKFEVQVLCKNANIRIEDIPRTGELKSLHIPLKDGKNPDFNMTRRATGSGTLPSTSNLSDEDLNTDSKSGGGGSSGISIMESDNGNAGSGSNSSSTSTSASNYLGSKSSSGGGSSSSTGQLEAPPVTVIPNLASYITLNPVLSSVGSEALFRKVFCLALDRAIVEAIQTAVEKAVSIVCVTAKHIILKDFATEGNERNLRSAAHLMVSGLASSLVVVSCRESLRIGIANHLRSLLTSKIRDEEVIEKVVRICTNDNLELGCALIEKATDEKVTQIIDENLAEAYQARQKSRESGVQFSDTSIINDADNVKYSQKLPNILKAQMGGLSPAQLSLYENYRVALQKTNTSTSSSSGGDSVNSNASGQSGGTSALGGVGMLGDKAKDGISGNNLTTGLPNLQTGSTGSNLSTTGNQQVQGLSQQQVVDTYQVILDRIEEAIQKVLVQSGSSISQSPVTLNMLPGESDIIVLMRELASVTNRAASNIKVDAAISGVNHVLNRLFASMNNPSVLGLETFIHILEILRDSCGGAQHVVSRVGTWLSQHTILSLEQEVTRKAHRTILLLLLRGKLLQAHYIDLHFAMNMDGGRNLLWVETALNIVRQSIIDGMGTAQDFANTFDSVRQMRPPNAAVRKQLQKWLSELQVYLNNNNQTGTGTSGTGTSGGSGGAGNNPSALGSAQQNLIGSNSSNSSGNNTGSLGGVNSGNSLGSTGGINSSGGIAAINTSLSNGGGMMDVNKLSTAGGRDSTNNSSTSGSASFMIGTDLSSGSNNLGIGGGGNSNAGVLGGSVGMDTNTLSGTGSNNNVSLNAHEGLSATSSSSPNNTKMDTSIREHVTVLLERWLRVWIAANEQVFGQYLQLMHQYGVLKTEESANRFFLVATELCVEACNKSQRPAPGGQTEDGSTTVLTFTVMDALSKLFLFLLRLADKESGDVAVRVNLLNRILTAIAKVLMDDHEDKKTNKKIFDQRPYIRLLSDLMQDLGQCDEVTNEPNQAAVPLLSTYNQLFSLLAPSAVPGFAFAWLQLISSKHFMPQLLHVKDEKGWPYMHRILLSLLSFLQPFLKSAQMSDPIRKLYKGTLRVLLVLLHDFPEFLCEYHLSFTDFIPTTCVQLRNLVLSAVPRPMKLQDPFSQNLNMESIPESSQNPRLPSDYASTLGTIRASLDTYLQSKQPPDFPTLVPSILNTKGTGYNMPLLNTLVTYVGEQGVLYMQRGDIPLSSLPVTKDSPSFAILYHLITTLDQQGIFFVLNAMVNQLRYPNTLTLYFNNFLMLIFAEIDNEFLREQMFRILLERLIVHRPHPVSTSSSSLEYSSLYIYIYIYNHCF